MTAAWYMMHVHMIYASYITRIVEYHSISHSPVYPFVCAVYLKLKSSSIRTDLNLRWFWSEGLSIRAERPRTARCEFEWPLCNQRWHQTCMGSDRMWNQTQPEIWQTAARPEILWIRYHSDYISTRVSLQGTWYRTRSDIGRISDFQNRIDRVHTDISTGYIQYWIFWLE